MGKRRVRNLLALGERDIIVFDPRADRREESTSRYGVKAYGAIEDAMNERPGCVVISTPPDRHDQYGLAAAKAGAHFFMEASVIIDGLDALDKAATLAKVVAAPSCTMRFHPAIKRAKGVLDEGTVGRVLAFTHHFGEYLPRWHPWEDYRQFYVSKRATGACREIVPFELVWLLWLCGGVKSVAAMKGRLGDLEADIDDVYQILIQFDSGALGHLLVDVQQRVGYRHSKFVCSKGVIEWDWDARRLRVFTENGTWREYADEYRDSSTEGFYIDEMEAFVKAARGEVPWPYPLSEDIAILSILGAAETSDADGVRVRLDAKRA